MDIFPRHVVCILGRWDNFKEVKSIIRAAGTGFTFDEEFSQLTPDERMSDAFDASRDRFNTTLKDADWQDIETHTAVCYILSPPMPKDQAQDISSRTLLLVAHLLANGGLAAKSESAGLAHGRNHWTSLGQKFLTAKNSGDSHSAAATLYWAWVQRLIHDQTNGVFHSVGMHLLGQRDTQIDDALKPSEAMQWIDLMGLYLVADQPDRPLLNGEGFRLHDNGPRRIIELVPCHTYDEDDFFFNPYGYHYLKANTP